MENATGRAAKARARRDHDLALVYLETDAGTGRPHRHVAVFREDGHGTTTEEAGHTHDVVDCELRPAADGHTHQLTTRRAAPVNYRRYRDRLYRRPTRPS